MQWLPNSEFLSYSILVATAALLFYLGITDLRVFKIKNEFVAVLAILFFLHAAVSGRWTFVYMNIAMAALMFAFMLFPYAKGLLGGGDVKMLTVAYLWVGFDCGLVFSGFLLGFTIVHYIAVKLKFVNAEIRKDGRPRIAYAPSVAAALIATFMVGCMAPVATR